MFGLKPQKMNSTGPKTLILVSGIFVTTDVTSRPMIDKVSICKNNCKPSR